MELGHLVTEAQQPRPFLDRDEMGRMVVNLTPAADVAEGLETGVMHGQELSLPQRDALRHAGAMLTNSARRSRGARPR